jgi:hypothetical protein
MRDYAHIGFVLPFPEPPFTGQPFFLLRVTQQREQRVVGGTSQTKAHQQQAPTSSLRRGKMYAAATRAKAQAVMK